MVNVNRLYKKIKKQYHFNIYIIQKIIYYLCVYCNIPVGISLARHPHDM